MYGTDTTFRRLLENPRVKEAFEKCMPDVAGAGYLELMLDLPIDAFIGYIPQKRRASMQVLLDLANGKDVEIHPVDLAKENPELTTLEYDYDIDDVDCAMSMLDKSLSGCLMLQFTKQMDTAVYGSISIDGKELPKGAFKNIRMMQDMQQLAVPIRKVLTEYAHTYRMCISGFVDTDGNQMEEAEIVIRTKQKSEITLTHQEHDQTALDAAREGIVLLKNDNHLLPLSPTHKLFVEGAESFRIAAVGAGKINPRYQVRLQRGLEEFSSFVLTKDADTALIVISRFSGENYDNEALKGGYYLTEEEETRIAELSGQYDHMIAVISSGYPMDVRWLEKYGIEAAIWSGFSGMLGGRAVVEILDGRVNPSGRLTDTWSNDYWDIPSSRNFYQPESMDGALDADCGLYIDTVYEEGLYVGYRYFDTFHKEVAYPFGHGLSYTEFKLDVSVVFADLKEAAYNDECMQLQAFVVNIGATAGKEVVQIYAAIPDGKLEQPAKRLIGFEKTKTLSVDEEQELHISIKTRELSSFDPETSRWIMEPGTYEIYAGTSSQNCVKVSQFYLENERILKQSEELMKPVFEMELLSKWKHNFPKGEYSGIKENCQELSPRRQCRHYEMEQVANRSERESRDLVSGLSVEELARISVCASHGWGMQETGVAGKLYRFDKYQMPSYEVADGNNGLNIHRPNIGMPCSSVVCSSWNKALAEKIGQTLAEEAAENQVSMVLAPAMNLHRNPLGGRNPEYFSEDPFLTGVMAGMYAKGLQANGVSTSMKHVIGNNCEASRKRNQSIIDVRTMRELYLKSFEIAMDIQMPDSIMTAYNAVNGCFTAEDEELLEGIFRREFGFTGFVMTDWNSYDTADVVTAVRAGNSWMTPGTLDDTLTQPIVRAVEDGTIPDWRLRLNVRRMLRVVERQTNTKFLSVS